MPLPNTVGDFWRLLYDYKSQTVVMMNTVEEEDEVKCILSLKHIYTFTFLLLNPMPLFLYCNILSGVEINVTKIILTLKFYLSHAIYDIYILSYIHFYP